jgi:NAD(P)H-flavin reductase
MSATLAPMVPAPWQVLRHDLETEDTFTLQLERCPGSPPIAFEPGQFNMLYLPAVGEVPISISGDPGDPRVLVHTTRMVGAVTRALGALRRGDQLGIRGPFGTAWPVRDAEGQDVVFVAGGIGLAPLRPAIHHVLAHRARYGRVVVLYGSRTPEDILFLKQLKQWRAEFDLEVHITVDRATPSWRGNVGVVTTLIQRAPFDPAQALAMICGPEVMMRFTTLELERRGVSADRIHLSLERNMQCGIGLCGHCQYGPHFICRDGAVFPFGRVRRLLETREV